MSAESQLLRFNTSADLIEYVCYTADEYNYDPVCPFPFINAGWYDILHWMRNPSEAKYSAVKLGDGSILMSEAFGSWQYDLKSAIYCTFCLVGCFASFDLYFKRRRWRRQQNQRLTDEGGNKLLPSLSMDPISPALFETVCLINGLVSFLLGLCWVDYVNYAHRLPVSVTAVALACAGLLLLHLCLCVTSTFATITLHIRPCDSRTVCLPPHASKRVTSDTADVRAPPPPQAALDFDIVLFQKVLFPIVIVSEITLTIVASVLRPNPSSYSGSQNARVEWWKNLLFIMACLYMAYLSFRHGSKVQRSLEKIEGYSRPLLSSSSPRPPAVTVRRYYTGLVIGCLFGAAYRAQLVYLSWGKKGWWVLPPCRRAYFEPAAAILIGCSCSIAFLLRSSYKKNTNQKGEWTAGGANPLLREDSYANNFSVDRTLEQNPNDSPHDHNTRISSSDAGVLGQREV